MNDHPVQVVLKDAQSGAWLHFTDPVAVIQTNRIGSIRAHLQEIERNCQAGGLYAAGFLAYEAAPAFDPAFQVRPQDPDFPLLWFGLFRAANPVELPEQTATGYLLGEWAPSVSRDVYDDAVLQIKSHIENGYTYQVNYTLRLKAAFSGDPWALFLQLARAQQASYSGFISFDRYAVCSASPELFFTAESGTIRSKPMKGTAARGLTLTDDHDQAQWLFHSEKNRAENVMIVDMIRNDLGRIAIPGSVSVPALFEVERYPTVWQMTSTVSARSSAGVVEIMQALFPCASITGAPKISTMRIISELETEPRKIYTGCIGFITPELRMQFNVAIRTVIVDRAASTAEYGVGGGITWDSTSAEEYEECRIKARLLTQPRPIFSLFETLLWEPESGYFLLDGHIHRLESSAEYFGFGFSREHILADLRLTAGGFSSHKHRVRLILDRAGKVQISASPLDEHPLPTPARLALAPAPISSTNPFLYHKTTYREAYAVARSSLPHDREPLLWNERGEATESDTANLVIRLDGRLITPRQSCGLLAGTFREFLLSTGEIEEGIVRLEDVAAADEIYLINSVRKFRPAVLERS